MSTISTTQHQPTIVAGEQAQSVSVQSQLASSTVDGTVTSKSNLGSIVGDLGAAHAAHAGWLEAETQKITQWGSGEIARLMNQAKSVEENLVSAAQNKQRALDESHKAELSRMVQQLDAKKAMELKELEDGLQRQIQAALNTTKNDINNIESEMNKRKMEVMQQAQQQTAKDVARLSNLSVEAKLIPSTTRTVIETNTQTGTVIAVAGGGDIKTGGAQASTISTDKITAAPMAGTLTQQSDVVLGDIRRDSDNQKVGSGHIVNTVTGVTQHSNQQPIVGATAAPVQAHGAPVNTGVVINETRATNTAAAPTATATTATTGEKHVDAAYGKPLQKTMLGTNGKGMHPDYNNKTAERDATGAHKEGLMDKIKHAVSGEPKSTDSHATKL